MPISQVVLDGIAGFVEEGVLGAELPPEGDGYRNWPVIDEAALPRRGPLKSLVFSYAIYGTVHLADTNDPAP